MSMKRREFLGLTCSCAAAISVLGPKAAGAPQAAGKPAMADMTLKHLTQGFWSADSLFLSAAKHLEHPEEVVRVAVGFGGGMHHKDLCGFLTGGIMSIGLFSGPTRGSDKASRDKCIRLTKEYYGWWTDNYKLHCQEIGSPCDYKEMAASSSEFLQKLFERESG
jgi:C_GCAxxG_C_C family probable redox protein